MTRNNKLTYIVASCWLRLYLYHDARIHEHLFRSVGHSLRFVDLTLNANKIFRIPFCVTNSKQSAVSPIWLDLLIKKLDIVLANIWPDKVQEWGSVRHCSARSFASPLPHFFRFYVGRGDGILLRKRNSSSDITLHR